MKERIKMYHYRGIIVKINRMYANSGIGTKTVMGIVEAKNLTFEYIRRDEEGNVEGITTAVDNVNIDIKAGDFVAVLGHNGSGKSTFAKHLNALVMPTEGTVYVDGMDTKDSDNTLSGQTDSRYGISESGQPDSWYTCR